MDPLLNQLWLRDLDAIPMIDEASVALVRSEVRTLGKSVGLPETTIESMAVVASELGHNQLRHARGGRVSVREVHRGEVAGIEVVAADRGSGIADPTRALFDRPSRGPSLGTGLGAVRRMAHEVDFDVRIGEGSCIWARGFAEPPDRRRELALFGRPADGEMVSGDAALFVRQSGRLTFGLADGLGHGPLAQDASIRAVGAIPEHARLPAKEILDASDAAAAGTRGAALTVGVLHEQEGRLELAAAGNVTLRVEGRSGSRSFIGGAYTVGAHENVRRRPARDDVPVSAGELIIGFTDGLSGRASLSDQPDLLREPPLVVAAWLMATFARGHDDALVLVIR